MSIVYSRARLVSKSHYFTYKRQHIYNTRSYNDRNLHLRGPQGLEEKDRDEIVRKIQDFLDSKDNQESPE